MSHKTLKYKIINISGKTLKQGDITSRNENINISHFPTGTYVVKIANGEEIYTETIIKQ